MPSANSRATLRQIAPISRSRLRTPGLARVALDDLAQRVVGELDLGPAEAVLLDLARHQVALGDLELLLLGVAGELDHLHAVAQRRRDRLELVRGGDEEDPREVERQVEVVVAEGGVLLGVEHLEHRARRVAAEVGAHLVDLVDHQDRVVRAGVAHARGGSCPASRRCRCGGGRGSRTRRARRRPRCARTRGPSPRRSSGRARSCRRPAGRRSRGSSCARRA